ncbi:MAG TPA: amidohydrolase, partial [Gammaproteobacteria bacterium]|nr:amidohydrolase [Gammaproteobacteria bacterium]
MKAVRFVMALLLVLPVVARAQAATGTLVLHDGAIYTLDDKQPWASAVVIHDGRIAYVGDETGLKPYLDGARVIDLHGEMVLPGFHDAHIHPMSGAMRLIGCRLGDAKTVQQLHDGLRAEAATRHPWVFCNGVPEAFAKDLSRAKLDELVPDRPAFVRTFDGFTGWANSKAFAAAGIDPDGTGPVTEGLERDPKTHKPTGLLTGDATSLVRNHVPSPTEAQYREALRRASGMANGFGITSMFDAVTDPDMLQAYHDADLAGELTLRVVGAQRVDPGLGVRQVDDFIQRRDAMRGPRFRADAAKIFMDEEIFEHTAAMLAPYADAPDSRGPVYTQEQIAELDAIVTRLDAADFLIHFHAMGDAAVRTALDALEQAAHTDGAKDRRHQIAHDGVVDPADIPRFGKLGVAANFSSIWFQADDAAYAPTLAALGPERSRWMYPIASIANAGGRLTGGSDWPQESMNPLDFIQYAVTRQPLDGGKPPLQPEQRITLAQAIAAYTKDAAWAVRDDKLDGTLEVGKAADLVVLDQNLFKIGVMSIHKTHVLLTL